MFHSSIRHSAIRILLLAGILQSLALACDFKSPVEPDTTEGSALQVPNNVMHSVGLSALSATALSWSQISLSWTRSPGATGYDVFRSSTGPTGSYTPMTSTTATTYVSAGLTGSTSYCYQVRAVKTTGKNTSYSAFSSAACATTLAPPVVAPSETDAAPDAGRVVIKWKDNSADEDGFHVEKSPIATDLWVQVVDAVANATSAYVYVSAEQQACFRVIAFNSIGPSLPSIPDCTTLPAEPTNLSAAVVPLSVNLTWTDNSAVEDGYKVSRSANGGAWTTVASLPANAVSYRDVSVTPGVSYRYVVQALKEGGYSAVSNQVTAILATSVPAAPSWAQASFVEGLDWYYLIIAWDAATSTNEKGFRLEYVSGEVIEWTHYATVDADVNSFMEQFTLRELPPPNSCYRVIAFNELGSSSPSNMTCVYPRGDPSDLTATAIDHQTIDLSWTDNAQSETGYLVERSTTSDGYYEAVATLPANTTSYRDTGLASGQEYRYVVSAAMGESNWSGSSNVASATTFGSASLKTSASISSRAAPRTVRVKGVTPRVNPHRDSRRSR